MRRNALISLLAIVALAAISLGLTLGKGKTPQLGLDLQGGASVVLTPKGNFDSAAIDKAKEIIRRRIDGLGVAEPEITRQDDAIVVSLPGVQDQQRALDVVGKTAELRFRPVLAVLPPDPNTPLTATTASTVAATATSSTVAGSTGSDASTTIADSSTTATTVATTTAAPTTAAPTTAVGGPGKAVGLRRQTTSAPTTEAPTTVAPTTVAPTTTVAGDSSTTVASDGSSPVTTVAVSSPPTTTLATTTPDQDTDEAQQVILPDKNAAGTVIARYVLGPVALKGDAVTSARTQFGQDSQWTVLVNLTGSGLTAWNALAARCYAGTDATCPAASTSAASHGAVAIVLDHVVISAPQFNVANFTGGITISGGGQSGFKQKEASDLAVVLKYGALPVQLVPQAVETVSATLGKDSLRAGVVAGLVGVLLVAVFMLLYYRALAVVVLFGLMVSAAILWSLISWYGSVLTLSGATGIIVSIGVTVDSYVVYFERLKDDVRSGRTLRSSAQRGFSGAWRTILAADTVSLIAALILYWQTVGSVRGFAFYLGLSTLIDMFVAYFFTRPAVSLLSQSRFFQGKRVLGITSGEALLAGGAR